MVYLVEKIRRKIVVGEANCDVYNSPRKLLSVAVLGASKNSDHTWHKTNLVTVTDRLGYYDTMRCRICGVTGKRFGLTNIKIDSQFRAKKYRTCHAPEAQ